jgi:hypothetical protein
MQLLKIETTKHDYVGMAHNIATFVLSMVCWNMMQDNLVGEI